MPLSSVPVFLSLHVCLSVSLCVPFWLPSLAGSVCSLSCMRAGVPEAPSPASPGRTPAATLVPPGGGLLVLEMLPGEDKREARAAVVQSLNMLVQTLGRERTLSEYRSLLQAHGFADVRAAYVGSIVDAVLATRV